MRWRIRAGAGRARRCVDRARRPRRPAPHPTVAIRLSFLSLVSWRVSRPVRTLDSFIDSHRSRGFPRKTQRSSLARYLSPPTLKDLTPNPKYRSCRTLAFAVRLRRSSCQAARARDCSATSTSSLRVWIFERRTPESLFDSCLSSSLRRCLSVREASSTQESASRRVRWRSRRRRSRASRAPPRSPRRRPPPRATPPEPTRAISLSLSCFLRAHRARNRGCT